MQRRTQHIQVVIVTLFASILIAILLSLGLLRSITKPIEQLTQSATSVVKGDLSHRVNVSTKDEIGQLANTFNGMLDSLQSSMVSKNYLETIIESMNDMLLVLSAEGRIQKINLAGQVVLGCKELELLDKSIETIITDIDSTAIAKLLGKGNEHIEPNDIKSIESGFITKSGVVVPVHLSVSVMKNEHNEIQGIVCVAQNLTEQKQAELEIKQGYKSLTDANLELMETQSQLIQSAKLASVGEMATGIAHELNQPLGVIAMSADLQLSRMKKGKGDTVEQSLALIIKQVERATTIINHLRTFGRESNKIARGIVSIKQMIKDSFIMHNEQLRLLDIEVIKEIDDNLPAIHCNAIQIEQVLSNLINNAKDALASSTTKQITVRARQVDTKVVIVVEDTGTGITQCNIERIFDPFFTTKEVGKGTGLGLSISYGIIKDHDGLLSVSSILGKGSMFFIELPGVKQEPI
jgi:PAS domain S-box-containing protein